MVELRPLQRIAGRAGFRFQVAPTIVLVLSETVLVLVLVIVAEVVPAH